MKEPGAVDSPRWSGRAWIAPGMAIFIGRAGHQDWHQHQAHQIALGLNALVFVESPHGGYTGAAVRIPAGVRHRLSGDIVMSIYLDVLSDEARALPEGRTLAPLEIATADVTRLIDALDETVAADRKLTQ
ncbi:arac family transcriptional regulator [Pseudomonas fluorescens]|nr:arac family transcriptional regulator [Pseudomonas fluorescens]